MHTLPIFLYFRSRYGKALPPYRFAHSMPEFPAGASKRVVEGLRVGHVGHYCSRAVISVLCCYGENETDLFVRQKLTQFEIDDEYAQGGGFPPYVRPNVLKST